MRLITSLGTIVVAPGNTGNGFAVKLTADDGTPCGAGYLCADPGYAPEFRTYAGIDPAHRGPGSLEAEIAPYAGAIRAAFNTPVMRV